MNWMIGEIKRLAHFEMKNPNNNYDEIYFEKIPRYSKKFN